MEEFKVNPEYLGLGRVIIPDERDSSFPMKAILKKAETPKNSKYWNANGFWGDQLDTSQCVGFGWMHFLEDAPITHVGPTPILYPQEIYAEAQKLDEFPGENYDGTTVRAGAKYLMIKGYITEYRWGYTLQELIDAVLYKAPCVVGTNWYYDMFFPDADGLIKMTGSFAGGHCYLVNGVNVKKRMFRIKNSWGRKWGKSGLAYISFDDMEKLIKGQGEICLAVEKPR